MLFTEDFLHYVWKFRLFDRINLQTTQGEELEIYSAGLHNTHAGPDFQNARIRIGETTWAGNAELHLSSSDWQRHGHTADNAYDNVILHVVYRDDEPLFRTDGRRVPTLELKDRISPDLYNRYHNLIFGAKNIIPCEASIATIDGLTMQNWLTRILVERLEKKSETVIATLNLNRGDWEETFYQFLAANFGFKTNALPFELMAKSLPQNILAKHKNNPMQIEALIFGQAGFLNEDFADEYPCSLKKEYEFLKKKFNITPIESHLWKFLRMRPQNFPTIRLAQLAALVVKSNHLFSKVLETKEVKALRDLFNNIQINNYWETHYQFDKESKLVGKHLGAASVDTILLNTVALFLFSYGRHLQQQYYISRSLKLLENIPGEQNSITTDFANLGLEINTAFESQALLELKNNYCDYKKCLQCGVGIKILKPA
jgi:predicted nucleic acid-binding protein